MKKLIRIVISIQFVLMLTHCATSTDQLYSEYTACRDQTLHPKITEAGVVMVHGDGTPVMVYDTGACPDQLAKWEKSHAMKEKRRREREAYQAQVSSCGDEAVPWCEKWGRDLRCGCIDKRTLQRILNGSYY